MFFQKKGFRSKEWCGFVLFFSQKVVFCLVLCKFFSTALFLFFAIGFDFSQEFFHVVSIFFCMQFCLSISQMFVAKGLVLFLARFYLFCNGFDLFSCFAFFCKGSSFVFPQFFCNVFSKTKCCFFWLQGFSLFCKFFFFFLARA